MRKLLTVLFAACILFYLALPAQAGYYTPSLTQLAGMGHTWDPANTTSYPLTVTNMGTAIEYVQRIKYGDGLGDGFASVGIGYGWQPPLEMLDLSAYDGIRLTFKNTNNSNWFVNIYLNTGWTDPPASEPDNFYQNDWIMLAPNATTIVTLDFATEGVIYPNHVTNIGFEIGGNMDVFPRWDPLNPSNADTFHVQVTPEPATMAILGLGALLLGRKRKE